MSEVRAADEAVNTRQESIARVIADSTGLDTTTVYRTLFIGMDLPVPEVLEIADEHAEAGCLAAYDEVTHGSTPDLHTYLSASWIDGFSVAAMLFLRRREQGR